MVRRIITSNLNEEFHRARSGFQAQGARVVEERPGYFARVNGVSGMGTAGMESDYLTEVERRAIMRSASSGPQGSSNITFTEPEIIGPLFDPINWFLPYTYKVLNRWIRYYDRFHPMIGNCLDMHSEVPLSRFAVGGIDDDGITQEYEDIFEELDLYGNALAMFREYWLLGECCADSAYLMMGNGEIKSIQDVRAGDTVLTHMGQASQVLYPTTRTVDEEICVFHVTGLPEPLEVTKNHPMYAMTRSQAREDVIEVAKGELAWNSKEYVKAFADTGYSVFSLDKEKFDFIPAEHLSKGDWLVYPIDRTVEASTYTPEFCRLLGYYLAEGWLHWRKNAQGEEIPYTVHIANGNPDIIEDIQRCWASLGIKTRIQKLKNCIGVAVDSKEIAQLFQRLCGSGSHEKKLDLSILRMEPAKQLQIVQAFFEGDGSVNSNGMVQMTTVSRTLAYHLWLMFLRNDIPASLKKWHYSKSDSDIFAVKLSKYNSYDFLRASIKAAHKAVRPTQASSARLLIKGDYLVMPIRDIEYRHYKGQVYNLEVEGDHSYVANGCAVHNCFPFLHWNPDQLAYDQLVILNPDFIHVNASPLAYGANVQLSLEPDDALIALVKSTDERNMQLRSDLDPVVIEAVEAGQNVPLDNFNVSQVARKASPYDLRGTSIVLRCFTGDTPVVMADGTRKPIQDIQTGESVWTHKGRVREVTDTLTFDVDEPLYEIQVDGQDELIKCTGDHPFLVWVGHRECACGCGQLVSQRRRRLGLPYDKKHGMEAVEGSWPEQFEWIKAKDLKETDYLCVLAHQSEYKDTEVTPEQARLFGYFLAEGHYLKENGVPEGQKRGLCFSFHQDETDTLAQDVVNLLQSEYDITSKIVKHNNNGIVVTTNFLPADQLIILDIFLHYVGEYSIHKQIASEIFLWPRHLQLEFLSGFFCGDGCHHQSRIGCSTSNTVLAAQISSMLHHLGIDNTLHVTERSDSSTGFRSDLSIPLSANKVLLERMNALKGEFIREDQLSQEVVHLYVEEGKTFQQIDQLLGLSHMHSQAIFREATLVEQRKKKRNNDHIVTFVLEEHRKGTNPLTIANTMEKLGFETVEGGKWSYAHVVQIIQTGSYGNKGRGKHCDRVRVGDYIVCPIRSISQQNFVGKVYDLTVEEDITFTIYNDVAVYDCLKDLLYEDKLREAQYAISDRHITPLKVFSLGDPQGEWIPDQDDIDSLASTLAAGQDDPNFALIGNFSLKVDYHGSTGKVLPVIPEFEFVEKRILTALFTNKSITHGEGPTYANASVAFEILQMRYASLRNLFDMWVREKVAMPIAEARGYRKITQAELNHKVRTSSGKSYHKYSANTRRREGLQIPEIHWLEQLSLYDDTQKKNYMLRLRDKGDIPLKLLCEVFDWDYAEITRDLTDEVGTVADPVYRQTLQRVFTSYMAGPAQARGVPGGGPLLQGIPNVGPSPLGSPGGLPGAMPGGAPGGIGEPSLPGVGEPGAQGPGIAGPSGLQTLPPIGSSKEEEEPEIPSDPVAVKELVSKLVDEASVLREALRETTASTSTRRKKVFGPSKYGKSKDGSVFYTNEAAIEDSASKGGSDGVRQESQGQSEESSTPETSEGSDGERSGRAE